MRHERLPANFREERKGGKRRERKAKAKPVLANSPAEERGKVGHPERKEK